MALRHIVLMKVEKKEVVPELVETLVKLGQEIAPHVSILSFNVSGDLGLKARGNADVALTIDFPDEESYLAYDKHPIHLAVIKKQLASSVTGIQIPLPKSNV